MKPYPKTKPSGVQWLGEVPEHWDVKRLKTEATCWVSNVDKVPSDDELPVRLCNYTDVYYNDRIAPDMGLMETTATADEIRRFGLRIADVVITKDSEDWTDIAVPALVSETAPDLVCGYHLGIIRSRSPRLHGDYLLRAFQSCAVNQQFQIAASGVTRYGLPKSAIGNAWMPFPSDAEQTAITAYLDRETGRIDELVGKKRDLIERLKEKRSALISRTVTRGLPADLPPATLARLEALAGRKLPLNPPLKPSGIDWLGEVPEHWEVKSLTRLAHSIRNGTSAIQLEDEIEAAVPVTRIESISGGVINFEKVGLVEWTPSLEAYRLNRGDILMSHINSLSMVGNCAVYDSERQLFSGMNLLRIQPEPFVNPYWLWRALSCDGIRKEISARAKPAINQASVTTNQIKSLILPVPSLPEQRAIAAYLDEETAKLDALVAKVETAIERLQEYRTALITAAVTGKIDVRGQDNKHESKQ